MYETTILRALQTGVIEAVAASTKPALPVAYVDVKFTKPNDGKWLEIVHIPNNRVGDFWGQEKNYRGLLRLVLHWPNTGDGPYAPLNLLQSIGSYFATGKMLGEVQITEQSDYVGAVREGDEVMYPVSVRYCAYFG